MHNRPSPYPKGRKYSPFTYGVPNLEYSQGGTLGYESVTQYCNRRFITRSTMMAFARRGWIVVIKAPKTRISVKEICSEEITQWLN